MIRKTKDISMVEGPILFKMLRFALPIMMTGVLQLLFNAADIAVVGRFASNGVIAVGAVGACGSLINLIVNSSMGLSLGVGVAVAHDIGSGSRDRMGKVIHTAVVTGAVLGLLVACVGFFFARPLLRLMDTPDNVLTEAVPYMKAYFLGIPASMIYNYLASALRSTGDTKRPLIFLTVAGVANVIFNLIMVLGLGLGAIGVGIATAISQYVALVQILVYMMGPKSPCRIRISELCVDRGAMVRIFRLGIPACLQSILFSISNVLIQSTVNLYGDTVISGHAAAANIDGFVYTAMNSVSQSVIVFAGQNMGAGKYRRLDRVLGCALLLVSIIGVALSVIAVGMGPILLDFYVPGEPLVMAAGMRRLIGICAPYALCGLMDTGSYMLKGMGKQLVPTMIILIGTCLMRVVWIYTICRIFPGSPEVPSNIYYLYASYPVTWVIASVGLLAYYMHLRKRLLRGDLAIHV